MHRLRHLSILIRRCPPANEKQNHPSQTNRKPKAAIVHKKQFMKNGTSSHMKTRQLGNSDLFITPVGYGSWAIGGSGWQFAWGKQNDDDSIAAIHRALELGVNWIDTAGVYGLGHSEEVVA